MFFLDIVPLHTNIPNEFVLEVITEKWQEISQTGFLQAINLVHISYFQYKINKPMYRGISNIVHYCTVSHGIRRRNSNKVVKSIVCELYK